MGNRATVVFTSGERISPAIYLHWNGGPESVYTMVEELDRRGVRPDAEYDAARFVQLYGELFDGRKRLGGHSLGIVAGPSEITAEAIFQVYADHGDNGCYVIDRNARSVRRFQLVVGERDKMAEWEGETVAAELDEWRRDPSGYRAGIADLFAEWTEGWEYEYGNEPQKYEPLRNAYLSEKR